MATVEARNGDSPSKAVIATGPPVNFVTPVKFITCRKNAEGQVSYTVSQSTRSFTIDYEHNTFLKDGSPFLYISGSIHYARVPYYYWKDRLDKMYAAGLDAIQVYIPWNIHEGDTQGVYDFEGQQDLAGFIKMAQGAGLLVILRAGPYICGEWEFGGFPAWLLKDAQPKLRTMDPAYIGPVEKWFSVLLPIVKPLLYENGGPVIMVQIENEYGSYHACDHDYMHHLRDLARKYLGETVVLYTTDGNSINDLKCGSTPGAYATVDFGPGGNVNGSFEPMREWNPHGPLVNSEFYTGWLDYWGHPHSTGNSTTICKSLQWILDLKASVNMYMFEGGTNFGYTNGADPPFNVCPTSYDYDAPLTEAGDPSAKYMVIRETIGKNKQLPSVPIPPATKKLAFGKVQMGLVGSVLELVSDTPVTSEYPLHMEKVGQASGFMLYRTKLPDTNDVRGSTLQIPGLRDRAQVLLSNPHHNRSLGILDRTVTTEMSINWDSGDTLNVFVENQGRVNFGNTIDDNRKGIISNVTLNNSTVLTNWEMLKVNLTDLAAFPYFSQHHDMSDDTAFIPSVFRGTFVLPESVSTKPLPDTFLKPDGWTKGQALINGFNLGRYWPTKGPQVTLYVPGGELKPHPEENVLVLLELDGPTFSGSAACTVEFVDTPILNGPTTGSLLKQG